MRILSLQRPDSVLKYTEQALSGPKTDLEYLRLKSLKAHALGHLFNKPKAIQAFMEAYVAADSLENAYFQYVNLLEMALVYYASGDYQKAIDLLNRIEPLVKDLGEDAKLSYLNNLAIAFDAAGMSAKAIGILKQIRSELERSADTSNLIVAIHNLAVAHAMLGEWESSKAYEREALNLIKQSGIKSAILMIYTSLGSLYLEKGNLDSAYFFLNQAESQGEQNGFQLQEAQGLYQNLANYHRIKGDYKKAFEYTEKQQQLKDSLLNQSQSERLHQQEAQFNFERMRERLELAELEKELSEQKASRSQSYLFIFGLALLLSVLLVLLFYRTAELRKHKNLVLEEQKKLRESENLNLQRENELLQRENVLAQFETLKSQVSPHFLFNSINALTVLIEKNPREALDFVSAFSRLYRAISEAQDSSLISLNQELRLIHDYLHVQKIRFGEALQIKIHLPTQSKQYYVPPFSVQMVLENAIKHNVVTATKPLKIEVSQNGDRLIIENNLQLRKVKDSTGIGLKNIVSRYKMLSSEEPSFYQKDSSYFAELPLLEVHD